jgi:hypothetical protein
MLHLYGQRQGTTADGGGATTSGYKGLGVAPDNQANTH